MKMHLIKQMNNSHENLEAPRGFFVFIYLKINEFLLLYILKKETIYMSWTDVKITQEKIDNFFNSINTDALAKNVDAMLDQLDKKAEKKQEK